MRVTLGSQLVDRQTEDIVAKSDYANTYSILLKKRGSMKDKKGPNQLANTTAYLITNPANDISVMTHDISYLDQSKLECSVEKLSSSDRKFEATSAAPQSLLISEHSLNSQVSTPTGAKPNISTSQRQTP